MSLTAGQRRALKAKAHHLKPVVQSGARGVTEALLAEADVALTAHELIKLRLAGSEREGRREAATDIARHLKAEVVDVIGAVVILYRHKDQPGRKPAS